MAESASPSTARDRTLVAIRAGYRSSPVVEPHGEVDFASRSELGTALRAALDWAAPLVFLDLRWLRFLDSAGLHVIWKADRRARALGKTMFIVRGNPSVQKVFDLTQLNDHLSFVDELPGAVPTP